MEDGDRWEIAELICVSTNYWYQRRALPAIFPGGPESTAVFFDVYQALDPDNGLVAVNPTNGRIMGSCFYHPRPTHASLGIMNVHPNYFGRGVARALLDRLIAYTDNAKLPLRLVSSAMNLDSYSLYTRAGFHPRGAFQDMLISVPDDGLQLEMPGAEAVSEATLDDLPALVALDREMVGIDRSKDWQYMLENEDGFWHMSAYRNEEGTVEGFMASSGSPGCNMIGPGVARTAEQAAALVAAELDRHRGRMPVFLVPVDRPELVQQMYKLGARNCEMHFSQVRGEAQPIAGIHMPTFLPESS
jgi:GNAT superfamily N-acetyltransferase